MPAFETDRKILFEHCDPAGIVFYPRYFEILNNVVEEWFETELGMSFADMHMVHHRGVPTVTMQVDFSKPSRLGEVIICRYGIQKLGNTSLTARFEFIGLDGPRISGSQVLVFANIDTMKPTPWTEALRERLALFTL